MSPPADPTDPPHGRRERRSGPARPPPPRAAPLALVLLLSAGIAGAGAAVYGVGAASVRTDHQRELASVASLKVAELARWREERLADGRGLVRHPTLLAVLDGREATPASRAALREWFEVVRRIGDYSALVVLDARGAPRAAIGPGADRLGVLDLAAEVARAVRADEPVLSELHRHGDEDLPHLTLIAPLRGPGGALRGATLLRIEPAAYLVSVLRSWPTPCRTARTLLVRAGDGDLQVLTAPPDGPAVAMAVAVDPGAPGPAARAMAGQWSSYTGPDHRGVAVMAAVAPVPGTPWALVAQVDEAEALAHVRERGLLTAAVVIALVAASGAGAAYWWRGRVAAFERRRFRAEAERAALARKVDLLTRWANDLVIVADEGHRIVEVNERAVAALGYSRAELLALTVPELRDPATVGDFEERVRQQLAREDALFETRYRRRDGTTFPVEVSVHVGAEDGRRLYYGIIRDISERRLADEALRASEARFRAAFEGANVGIALIDAEGRFVDTNRALRLMLGGFEDGELRGRSALDLIHPDERQATRDEFAAQRAGSWARAEWSPRRLARRGGGTCDVAVRLNPVGEGEGRYVVALVEDVSEKKRLQAQLHLADRMASLGTLAAGVAHEINNPLAYVLANLEYALAELRFGQAPGPEVLAALDEAREGGARVRGIVRDLRAFSRSDDGRRELLDVREVLQAALRLASTELRHRARLEVSLGEAPAVLASEQRLGQVFLNLLVNAAQAVPDGRAEAHLVRASTFTAADGRAVIEVSDNGTGIAPEHLPHVFDPFFTTKPVGVGTGLGLSICHGIVSAHGGEIRVESAPGCGACFQVILPPATGGVAATAAAPGALVLPAPRRALLLVVDDEPLVGRAVQRILSAQHDVEWRASAREALEALEGERPYALILCDLMMPDMSGMELHEHLRARAPGLAARMVFLTGGAYTARARTFLAEVPNPCLEKPFEPAALCELVEGLLAGARGGPRAGGEPG